MATETKHTKPFYNNEIPSDWEVKRLEEACSHFKSGFGITSEQISESGIYPVYGGNGLRGFTESFTHEGDFLLIGRQGALCGNIQIVSDRVYISEHAIAVQTNNHNDLDYLAYKLEFKNLNRLSESSAQPGLAVEKLLRLKVEFPPLPEQKAIAQVLSTADAAIHTTEKLIAQKELRKKWLMQNLLMGKMRMKGFGAEWKEKKLEYFIKEYKQKPTAEDNYEVLTSAKSGLIKQTDYYGDNRITNRDDADYNVIPPNYLTYRSRSDDGLFTFNKNDLGITGLISGYYPVFTIKNGDLDFILMYMNYYKQKLTKYAIGTSQLVLAMNALKEAKFVLPEHEEQTAIAQVLQAADKEISLLKAKAEKLREQKKGLMQVLLTGKKRLKTNDI
ncbi:MAG: restriction endonuclease subunit S [Chitinophagaceae bacterium]|nr:restriction endonuclease subunit S [Chitinophagaceae bacterium]